MTELAITEVVDCSGMLCPIPVVKTAKAIKGLQPGDVLKLISTDPGAPPDMIAWAKQTGNDLLENFQEDGKYIFIIKKN